MLAIVSVGVVLLNLFGLINFAWIPSLFGVYGPERSSLRSRLITWALIGFPVVSAMCLIIAWSDQQILVSLLPFAYLLILWIGRGSSQDIRPYSRRHSNLEENLKEQIAELEYKWASWNQVKSNSRILTFELHVFESKSGELIELLPGNYEVRENVKMDEKSARLIVYTPIRALEKNLVIQQIQTLLSIAWPCDAELESTEVE